MSDTETPSETREERIYEQVLRMVLWGETEEAAFKKMEVNGFTAEKAREMYRRARAERVWAIRKECLKSFCWGLPWLSAGVAGLYGMWVVARAVSAFLLILAVGAVAFGGWKVVKGLIGYFAAPFRTGSLANED